MRQYLVWRSLILVAAVSTAAASCDAPDGEKNPSEEASVSSASKLKKVRVSSLTKREIVDKRTYAADLEASTEVTLYPMIADRILSFPWEDGDPIKAGQTVARIKASGLKKGIAQMQAEIESLDQTIDNQSRELERSKELYSTNIISQQTLEQIQSNYSAQLAKRKSLEASLGQVEVSAGNALIKSPVSGFVIQKQQEEGDTAQMGRPLCSIVSVDPIRVTIGITEKDVAAVRQGMNVELVVDAVPGHVFHGKVIRILPVLDTATRTNEVRIDIENPVDAERKEPLLKPGMFGRVSILIEQKAEQLVVPARALMVSDSAVSEARRVFVVDNQNVAHEKLVRVGVRNDGWYEVLSGLTPMDRVVLRGQYSLRDKDKVDVLGELKLDDKGEVAP